MQNNGSWICRCKSEEVDGASGSRCQDLCSGIWRGFVPRSDQYLCSDPIESNTTTIHPFLETRPPSILSSAARREEKGKMQVSGFVRRLDQLLPCSVDWIGDQATQLQRQTYCGASLTSTSTSCCGASDNMGPAHKHSNKQNTIKDKIEGKQC